tara:strand:- start:310 stop:441 length:132 start_codon:yes stop_codon:yes gene_type:complete
MKKQTKTSKMILLALKISNFDFLYQEKTIIKNNTKNEQKEFTR